MKPTDLVTLLTLAAMLLAAGLWLGALNTRVDHLERESQYLHGHVDVPKGP